MLRRYPLKPVLDKRQKTYQQRKHLQNLMKSRGLVNSSSPWRKPNLFDSSRSKLTVYRRSQINKENKILLSKLSNITENNFMPKQNKFTMLSQTLTSTVAQHRERKCRDINSENRSLYQRLAAASPCLQKKKQWLKAIETQNKYRNNAMRKVKRLDYTALAESQIFTRSSSIIKDSNSTMIKPIKKIKNLPTNRSSNVSSSIR